MNWARSHLFVGHPVERSFTALVNRTFREQRCEERRLAEQRTRQHTLQARKSCVSDARSYRVARRLHLLATAQFD
jgi:hypothetical protein